MIFRPKSSSLSRRKPSACIAAPLPDEPPGYSRKLPNPRSSSPASTPGDTLLPTNSSVPSPPGLGYLQPHLSLQNNLTSPTRISALEITLFDFMLSESLASVSAGHIQPAPVCSLTFPPTDHCSVFDNQPAELPHEYLSGPIVDPIFSSDISSPSMVRKYRPFRIAVITARARVHSRHQHKVSTINTWSCPIVSRLACSNSTLVAAQTKVSCRGFPSNVETGAETGGQPWTTIERASSW